MGMLTGYQEYQLVLRCVFDPKRGPVMLTKGELNRNDLLKITFVDLEQMGKALKDTTNIHLSMRGPGWLLIQYLTFNFKILFWKAKIDEVWKQILCFLFMASFFFFFLNGRLITTMSSVYHPLLSRCCTWNLQHCKVGFIYKQLRWKVSKKICS